MTARLFVYGTLRRDAPDGASRLLRRGAIFDGPARATGRLFALGGHPGLVPSPDARAHVRGELWVLDDPADTLARLDAYEGCGPNDPRPHAFARIETRVARGNGTPERAWVYAYVGSTTGRREIRGGDWVEDVRRRRRSRDVEAERAR